MVFKSKRKGIIHKFTMDVDPGYKYIEKFRGGVQWYMMESKDTFRSISFNLKKENNKLVSFNGQSITFRLSIKEIQVMDTYKNNYMSTYTWVYLHLYEWFYYLYHSILKIIRDMSILT